MSLNGPDEWNRRRFMGASLAVASRTLLPALAEPGPACSPASGPEGDVPVVTPRGEFAHRIELTARRFLEGTTPAFTPEFVLADVALTPPRRFNEYSGDLSGRYLEALSVRPVSGSAGLDALVTRLLSYQRKDGRFGNADLVFRADSIGPGHMALLWGNGRLLIGLLAYYKISHRADVLDAARKLGEFLLQIHREAERPEVRQRLVGQGASGFICFTQLVEGLVMLEQATGQKRYLERAEQIAPLLQPRGIQHAHGYLATLRGILDLANATGNQEYIASVEAKYADLTESSDCTVFGSVREYFGWGDPAVSDAERKGLIAASGGDPRDEGCGHADFLRLSLGLWRATGKPVYLERAERCFWNGFLLNQWSTGDFGSRVFSRTGLKPTDNVNRSWWCCTMHGYRAFPEFLGSTFTCTDEEVRVNLFIDSECACRSSKLKMGAGTVTPDGFLPVTILVQDAGERELALSLRQPGWAGAARITLNGKAHSAQQANGYWTIRRVWQPKDEVNVSLPCSPRLLLRDGGFLTVDQLGEQTVEGAMFYGPWLLGVDERRERLFFGEPWQDNLIYLPATVNPAADQAGSEEDGPVRLRLNYEHGGFTGRQPVSLVPVYTTALDPRQSILAVWLRYRRE